MRDGGEDLFQEIAMALWTALPRFRGVGLMQGKPAAMLLGAAALLFATATAGFVVLWWLNERFGVRKLKDLRAKAAAMFEAAD